MADDKSTVDKFADDVKRQLTPPDLKEFIAASDELNKYARTVNETFLQGRQRISELSTALADATPGVRRLGGDIGDVSNIITKVAEESKRNVIANTESIEKLYAASKVLNQDAGTLTKAFLDVGAGIETIPKSLEESIQYVQSIGGNAQSVMKDVTDNMSEMNRYQFEGGVQGMTKMAAQASMLRTNMATTLNFAENLYQPEKAVEVAAAFQRLGVAAGNLTDPFALMNASINDPSGLQNSLADVAKQFTYFDEKTKTFKINPQGVLTLKEMGAQAGVNSGELMKMGLAAAELDKRMSDINKAGVKFGSEEDKQYLANIASMKDGEYVVKLKNESGIEETKKLSEITQDEFDKLIQEQKEGPKTLEDLARSQMSLSEVMKNDVSAIRAKVVGGVVSAGQVLDAREGLYRGGTALTGAVSKAGSTRDVRRETERAAGDLVQLKEDILKNNMSTTDALSKYFERVGNQTGEVSEKLKNSMTKALEEARANTTDKTAIERAMQQGYDYVLGKVAPKAEEKRAGGNEPISSLIEGKQSQMKDAATQTGSYAPAGGQNSKVEVAGSIKIDITAPPGFSDEKIQKLIYDKLNEQGFKDYIVNVTTAQNPTKAPVGSSYAR